MEYSEVISITKEVVFLIERRPNAHILAVKYLDSDIFYKPVKESRRAFSCGRGTGAL